MPKEKNWLDEATRLCIGTYQHIEDMIDRLEAARDEDDWEVTEAVETEIHEYPLSIELAGKAPIGQQIKPDRFEILLSTGGPAVRIVGELNDYGEAESATIEAQDWFKPWTAAGHQEIDDDKVLAFCNCFYFGE